MLFIKIYIFFKIVKLETTDPSAPTIAGGSSSWSSKALTINVSKESTAISEIKNYQYCEAITNSVTNCSWNDLTNGTKSVSISTNGTNYIFFRAVSNAGRNGKTSTSQTTMIDTATPNAPGVSGGSTEWISSSRTFALTAPTNSPSGIQTYEYYITNNTTEPNENTNPSGNSASTSISINQTGTYIYFRSVNNAGTKGSWTARQNLYVDTTTPVVAINSSIPDSVLKDSNYNVLGSYSTNGPSSGSVSCSSNLDGNIANINQLITIGNHTIACTATTGAKKTITVSKNINITYNSSTVFTMKNLATNGSFENGISEWYNKKETENWFNLNLDNYPHSIPKKYGNYAFYIQVINSQSFARASYNTTSTLANHKVYARVFTLIDYGTDLNPGLYLAFANGPEMWPTQEQNFSTWYSSNGYDNNTERRIWRSLALYETATYNYFKIMLTQINSTGNGVYFFDGLTVVDLTAAFGAGNEPDKDWCDSHINYFDGTQNIKKN